MYGVIFAMVFGIGILLLIGVAFYRTFVKEKNPEDMYTPYDDMTKGTNDTNNDMHVEEDTKHTVHVEENKPIE